MVGQSQGTRPMRSITSTEQRAASSSAACNAISTNYPSNNGNVAARKHDTSLAKAYDLADVSS